MVSILATVSGLLLLAVTGLVTASALRIRGRAPFLLASLVMGAASVILLFEVLSLVNLLTRPAILVGQVVMAGGAAAAWWTAGRPRPRGEWRPSRSTLALAARAHPAVATLGLLVLLSLALQLVMAVTVAPNNSDSMTYHLSRAAYWLENRSAMQWTGGSVRQLYAAPNAEMLVAWTMSISGTDRLAALVQWTALAGLCGAIFSTSRVTGFPVAASCFAAGLFAVMPQPIMQATTTQNDLVASFFIVSSMLFGIRGLRDGSLGDLVPAAASGGLAIGTKGTALIAVPSFALLLGYALWRYRPPRRFVLIAGGLGLCGVLAFGTFHYALTLEHTHTLFGGVKGQTGRVTPVGTNLARVLWTFADSPAAEMSWLRALLDRPFHRIIGNLSHAGLGLGIDTSTQEDTTAFGLTGLFIFLPLLLAGAVGRRSPPWRRAFALAGLAYLLIFAITIEWNPWAGRVMTTGVAIGAPLLASVALRPLLSGVALTLALLGLVPSLLTNVQKPLLVPRGARTVLGLSRLQQQTLSRPEMLPVLSQLDAQVGPSAPLGFVGSEDSWDYPLFGEHRERRVVRLNAGQVNIPFMARNGLIGVFFANVTPPPPLVYRQIAPDYYLVLAREQRSH